MLFCLVKESKRAALKRSPNCNLQNLVEIKHGHELLISKETSVHGSMHTPQVLLPSP